MVSLVEICITTIITVLLVFIGCLVLGLQIKSIKSTISSQQTLQNNTLNSLTTMEADFQAQLYSMSNDSYNLKKNVISQGVDIYNAQQGLNKFQNVQQQQASSISGVISKNAQLNNSLITTNNNVTNTNSILNSTNDNLNNLVKGDTPFSSLKVGQVTFQPNIMGDFTLNTSGSNFVIGSSNTIFQTPGACIQLGANKICNMGDNLNVSGNLMTSNITIGNVGLTTQEGMLQLQDNNGLSRGLILNGIKQTMPGSMIDYNGFGIGEYENGVMRTYAPSGTTSKISMSFQNPDSSFTDVVSVKGDGLNIQGNLTISGSINNSQIQTALAQSQQALSIANTALATIQEQRQS